MWRLIALPCIVVLTVLALVGPSFAQAMHETKSPAQSSGQVAKSHHLTGKIVSVDAQAKTFVVERVAKGKSREYTFAADKDAVQALAQLKPGDRVRVSYIKVKEGMTAERITEIGRTAKK